MNRLKAFFVLFCFMQSTIGTSTSEKNDMEYSGGSSIETKYAFPNSNISVNSGNSSQSSFTVKSSLPRVLDFYNSEMLAASWNGIKKSLSEGCQKDVEAYIQGLGKAQNWALKSKCFNDLFISIKYDIYLLRDIELNVINIFFLTTNVKMGFFREKIV